MPLPSDEPLPGAQNDDYGETSPADAIVSFSEVLDNLASDERETTVQHHVLHRIGLVMLEFRRWFAEGAAEAMKELPVRERERALIAYQNVCRQVTELQGVIENELNKE